jgi:hypothetical protein
MAEEVSRISEIKTTSDGSVNISIEKYNELCEQAAAKPAVIHRTTVIKTPEMAAQELRVGGGSLMGLGGAMFVIGSVLLKIGRSKI